MSANSIGRKELACFFSITMLWSLLYSKFVISVSMIGILVAALLSWDRNRKIPLHLRPDLVATMQSVKKQPQFWIITLIFLIVLISGTYSSDFNYWSERLRIKLPFLLLPFAFALIPALSKKQFYGILYWVVLLMFGSGILVVINYFLHFEALNIALSKGQPIPTPMNHIRYSLMLAIGIISGLYLFKENFYIKYPIERYLLLLCTICLFGFIHVLSVRSGLLTLYLALFTMCFQFMIIHKKYIIGLITIAFLISIPFLAYHLIPSFKTKVSYVMWDIGKFKEGNGKSYSDSERILSLQIGMSLAQEHPLIGVGAGDLKQEIHQIYKTEYPQQVNYKMPHNQFLSVLAGTGIIGLMLFLLAFFYPLFYQKNYQSPIFLGIHVILFFSFLMENTIENSIGVAIYLFFILLFLNYKKAE